MQNMIRRETVSCSRFCFYTIVIAVLATKETLCATAESRAQNSGVPGGRIIGGDSARSGQFPFATAIHVTTGVSRFFCGGTLLDHQWILTAAQCVHQAVLFTIHLGSNHLTADDSSRLTLATSEYAVHPNYNSSTLENDIGLIKLRIAIQFTTYIAPVDFLATVDIHDDALVTAIGWGQTSDSSSSLSDELRHVRVTAITNDQCRLTFGNQITDNVVCVDGNYNEGTCNGDTGSALLQGVGVRFVQHVGVASFHSGAGCESVHPSGYTRTYAFADWIRNVSGLL